MLGTVDKLLQQLEDNTKGYEINGMAELMLNGKPYKIIYTDQHKYTPSNKNYWNMRKLERFYQQPPYILRQGLPKHIFTVYDKVIRVDLYDPLELEESEVKKYIVDDINQLL